MPAIVAISSIRFPAALITRDGNLPDLASFRKVFAVCSETRFSSNFVSSRFCGNGKSISGFASEDSISPILEAVKEATLALN